MSLADQIQQQIHYFLATQVSLAELRRRLAEPALVQSLAASEDPEARELSDRVWILLSESDYGDRNEDELRLELADLVATPSR